MGRKMEEPMEERAPGENADDDEGEALVVLVRTGLTLAKSTLSASQATHVELIAALEVAHICALRLRAENYAAFDAQAEDLTGRLFPDRDGFKG